MLVVGLILSLIVGFVIAFGGNGNLFKGSLAVLPSVSTSSIPIAQDPTILAMQSKISALEVGQKSFLSENTNLKAKVTLLQTESVSIKASTTFLQASMTCIQTIPLPVHPDFSGSVQEYLTYLDTCLSVGNLSQYY